MIFRDDGAIIRTHATPRHTNRAPQGADIRFDEEATVTSPDRPTPETEALRQRISMLSAAILRISASLDMATVL